MLEAYGLARKFLQKTPRKNLWLCFAHHSCVRGARYHWQYHGQPGLPANYRGWRPGAGHFSNSHHFMLSHVPAQTAAGHLWQMAGALARNSHLARTVEREEVRLQDTLYASGSVTLLMILAISSLMTSGGVSPKSTLCERS